MTMLFDDGDCKADDLDGAANADVDDSANVYGGVVG